VTEDTLTNLALLRPEWEITQRVAELAGPRSGDVLLVFGEDLGTRYIGWHWEYE
jgi:hypothetical protein